MGEWVSVRACVRAYVVRVCVHVECLWILTSTSFMSIEQKSLATDIRKVPEKIKLLDASCLFAVRINEKMALLSSQTLWLFLFITCLLSEFSSSGIGLGAYGGAMGNAGIGPMGSALGTSTFSSIAQHPA